MSDGSAGISEQQGVFANGEEASMVLLDDIPFFSRGNWVTGLTISVGTMVVLPLVAPILRPLAKAAIKGGLQAYQGATGWVGDLVAEAVADGGRKVAEEALEEAATAASSCRQISLPGLRATVIWRKRGNVSGLTTGILPWRRRQ